MNVLITGATGFVGGWLTQCLAAKPGYRVLGISRSNQWPNRLEHLVQDVPLELGDCTNATLMANIISNFKPTIVVHLAGFTSPGLSFRNPSEAWHDNLEGTRGIMVGIEQSGLRPKVLHVSTGLVYATPKNIQSLDENAPLEPASPYAASKLAGEYLAQEVANRINIPLIIARPFNHIGPGQGSQFAIGSFAKQVATIARSGKSGVIETGNLQPRRDLTDVRDIVNSYCALMPDTIKPGIYNIGTGTSYSMANILDRLIALSGVEVEIRTRDEHLRPGDPLDFRANCEKIRQETGWMPAIPLDTTLRDILASFDEA